MNKLRVVQFIDGENLVARYQAMLAEGRKPRPDVAHESDVFVWHDGLSHHFDRGSTHIYYYTSVVGDDARVTDVKRKLAAQTYRYIPLVAGGSMLQVVPSVFKKSSRSQKTRNVDIQIVIDVMRTLGSDACDMVLLTSGDGDYLPLLFEAMRSGKQVCAAALSSGLHPSIPHSVSKFINLDDMFFLSNAG